MDKFEFSDLYKFLVSAGIILIALSILTPWFYLKEPFDLLIEKEKIKLLTLDAQNIIRNRQSLIAQFYNIIPLASIILFVLGFVSIAWGLYKWFKKQADIDERDRLTTKKLKREVENMTDVEIEIKNEEEFEEATDLQQITTTTTTTPIKETFITKYTEIEKSLITKISSLYSDIYNIQPHIKIRGGKQVPSSSRYDLILNVSAIWIPDCIFEFKYYPYGVTKSTIRENLIRLDKISKNYSKDVKFNVKPILLIVLPSDKMNSIRFMELKKLPKELNLANKNIALDFINIEDINKLDKEYFDSLIRENI